MNNLLIALKYCLTTLSVWPIKGWWRDRQFRRRFKMGAR